MLNSLHNDEHGFTLIEVLVAAVVLAIGVFGTVALVDGSNRATANSMSREGATNLTRQLTEDARLISYPKADGEQLVSELQARPDLADASPTEPGWQLVRRGRTYTVDASVCMLDDLRDGSGDHDGSFCAGSTPGSADGNPKDYKRVSFRVRWGNEQGEPRELRQTTILTPRGSADLPKVTRLAMSEPLEAEAPATPIITSNALLARFNVTTSTTPRGVSWLVKGGVKGLAGGGGISWWFDWPLTGVSDGTYEIGAQPFDASGASVAPKTMEVTLNRELPLAPGPLYAGFNVIPSSGGQRRIDVEWVPNTAKDILGYRVFWQYASLSGVPTGSPTQVCSNPAATPNYQTTTSCSWTMPDSGGSDQVKLNVSVEAIDKDGATQNLRAGTRTVDDAYAPTNNENKTPYEPTSLVGERMSDGTVQLAWNPSAGTTGDPDPGDKVIFYRIFRKAGSPPQRCDGETPLASTPFESGTEGPTRRWVDAQPLSGSTTYAVCAVDRHMRLSNPPTQVTVP